MLWKQEFFGEKKFKRKGQEETFLRFTLDRNGNLVGSFRFLPKRFVRPQKLGSTGDPFEWSEASFSLGGL